MAQGFGRLGWFFGLIFGAIFGVLFAPRKGKELRARMKAERKKGHLGISPLQDDFRLVGQEIATIAKDLYASQQLQGIVEMGRTRIKGLSDDFVEGVSDFHVTRIEPLKEEFDGRVSEGRKFFKKAQHGVKTLKSKVRAGAKIGKQAITDMKRVIKRKEK